MPNRPSIKAIPSHSHALTPLSPPCDGPPPPIFFEPQVCSRSSRLRCLSDMRFENPDVSCSDTSVRGPLLPPKPQSCLDDICSATHHISLSGYLQGFHALCGIKLIFIVTCTLAQQFFDAPYFARF